MTHCMNKKCKVFVAEQIKISYNMLKNTKAALKLIRCSLFVSSIKIFTTLTHIQNCLLQTSAVTADFVLPLATQHQYKKPSNAHTPEESHTAF